MKLAFSILFYCVIYQSFGQLSTTGTSASNAVQNTLLGPGVSVSNISYVGQAGALGTFSAAGTNLGIASGVVITTGTILNNGSGPHGPNNQSNAGFDNPSGGFTLLTALSGNTTFDAAILEFDFIPYSDTVRFKYVFGSEEYPEYVGSQFNDVFGFFISGPGIAGNQNIARLPVSGLPVAINNVNNGNPTNGTLASNPFYFVENGDGSQSPYNSSSAYIQYDGFTKPLEAVSRVQCGETYHLIIAIADVGDGIFDSGIFLEANSLSSKVPVEIEAVISSDSYNDGVTMAEGCVSATVTLTRGANGATSSLTIPVTNTGTATEGVDYSSTPNSVTFAPGQLTTSFTFNAFADVLTEGVETVNLGFTITDPCGNQTIIPINLKIADVLPVTISMQNDSIRCEGESVTLSPVPLGGGGQYSYLWSPGGATTPTLTVSPTSTTLYTVSVTDQCLGQSASAIAQVVVPIFAPLVLTSSPDIVEICPFIPATLSVIYTGGAGDVSYVWSTPDGQQIGIGPAIQVTPSTTTLYNVTATDACGNTASEQLLYTITSPPLLLTMSPPQLVCPGDSALITVSATGGYGQYFFDWQHSNESSASVYVNPLETTTYTVIVSDECQTFTVSGQSTVNVTAPYADFQITSQIQFEDLPIQFQNLTTGGQTYIWNFGDGNGSTIVHPLNTYLNPGTYTVTLVATNEIGCVDTSQKLINIYEEHWIYVPNTFTPEGNIFNNYFSASTINISKLEVWIYNRWGELVFTDDNPRFAWDATFKDQKVPDGVYTYKIRYFNPLNEELFLYGHVNVLR
jgi:gliding motility-associated-like protein